MKINPGIYTPYGMGGYELCHTNNVDDLFYINNSISGSYKREWVPIQMNIIHEDEGLRLIPSDAPWLGSQALIFKMESIKRLVPMLEKYGELLPLENRECKLLIFNVTKVIDALDETRSSVSRFSDGRLIFIKKYFFKEEKINGIDVFKISNLKVSPTFVSHRFIDVWRSNGLNGLGFKLVWSSPI